MLIMSASGCEPGTAKEGGQAGATPSLPAKVRIETTYGDMVVQLSDSTPKHRDNFLKLVEEGFYDSLLFHRVINEFMVQGGDPDSRGAAPGARLGSGGPGYRVDAEIRPDHLHFKGALAAARQGDNVNPLRQSSGSQFYIVQGRPFSDSEMSGVEGRIAAFAEEYGNGLANVETANLCTLKPRVRATSPREARRSWTCNTRSSGTWWKVLTWWTALPACRPTAAAGTAPSRTW
jgi:cyclophilin family peptidyl-prolyl cis-trans isomerase